ncbi:MAG: heme ABC exporter ATP-binding protein CcmA [Alphaproteobacteria bacterium]|nr:heme ABC exporter ATP-binding protein CcmA [Alphaproteobacteria bacterium]
MKNGEARFEGDGLVCVRGERMVFAGLSFALGPGDALVLRGPNGSGKSSLLRLAAGLLQPAEGRLRWPDGDIREIPEAHRGRLVYVGHRDAIKAVLTVEENLAFWAGLAGGADLVPAALSAMALEPLATTPGQFLSAGQRRRLTLARLFVGSADLWLLDEPSVGLDSASVAALETALRDHRARGGLVMVATHTDLAIGDARPLDLDRYAARAHAAQEAMLS